MNYSFRLQLFSLQLQAIEELPQGRSLVASASLNDDFALQPDQSLDIFDICVIFAINESIVMTDKRGGRIQL